MFPHDSIQLLHVGREDGRSDAVSFSVLRVASHVIRRWFVDVVIWLRGVPGTLSPHSYPQQPLFLTQRSEHPFAEQPGFQVLRVTPFPRELNY